LVKKQLIYNPNEGIMDRVALGLFSNDIVRVDADFSGSGSAIPVVP
jgi:hypothetical protein